MSWGVKLKSHKKKLRFIFYKHWLEKKKYWWFFILEIFLPITLFVLYMAAAANYKGLQNNFINKTTIPSILSVEDVFEKMPYAGTQIYYVPQNAFTNRILKSVRLNLNLIIDGE